MQVLTGIVLLLTTMALSNTAKVRHEWKVRYATYNPDGVYRTVLAIYENNNFNFPGPTIRAIKDDWIEVIVHNELATESISIHWHGMHQMTTPWMDGVSHITQYPILPKESFNYTFRASPVGTHWYHSHTGAQYADGLFGALIIDDLSDPYANIPECTLTMTEWWHKYALDQFDILTEHPTPHHHNFPHFVSGIMNGKGRHNCSLIQQPTLSINLTTEEENQLGDKLICTPNHPYERFVVAPDQTYRFRLIAAGSEFNYKFSIDNHNLTIVAVDGVYIKPHQVQQLWIYIGQRYDVLVTMNQRSSNGAFWIRAAIITEEHNQFYAILQYNNAANQSAEPPPSILPPNQTFLLNSMPLVPISNNTGFNLKPPAFNKTARILHVTCAPIAHRCSIESISYKMPHEPTLYTLFKSGQKPLEGSSTINLNVGDEVMIIINNFQDFGHPFHLHGHSFYLLGVGNRSIHNQTTVFDPTRDRHLLNFVNPPYRDTEQLPELSYMVIGFIADNPGSWLLHCHLAWDMEAGMLALFNVLGGHIPAPPDDFPLSVTYKDIKSSGNEIRLTVLVFCFLSMLLFIR